MTFLAIDFGARRLGLALSDEDERLCWPLQTQTRRPNDARGDIKTLLDLMRARAVEGVVMGIPGGSAASDEVARGARQFAAQLERAARAAGLELQFFETDERFSSAQAQGELRSAGIKTRTSRESGGADSVDARAAAVFLQTFLDSRNHGRNGTTLAPHLGPDAQLNELDTDDSL
jgi:putative Holliday junction resolvase